MKIEKCVRQQTTIWLSEHEVRAAIMQYLEDKRSVYVGEEVTVRDDEDGGKIVVMLYSKQPIEDAAP